MSRPGELACLRCRTPLQFMGTKKFHEALDGVGEELRKE